jgi:hypothetical protein
MEAEIERSVERLENLLKEAIEVLSSLKTRIASVEKTEKIAEGEWSKEETSKEPTLSNKKSQITIGEPTDKTDKDKGIKKTGIMIGDERQSTEKGPSLIHEEKQKDAYDRLLDSLKEVLVEADKAFLSADDIAPLKKAVAASDKVKEDSEKGEFSLGISVLLVRLLYKCFGAPFSSLRQKANISLKAASEIISTVLNAELFYKEGIREEEVSEGIEKVMVYSARDKGEIVALLEPLIRREGKVFRKGKALVSAGEEHPIASLCEKSLEVVAALQPQDELSRTIRSELLDELRKRQALLYPLKQEHHTAQLRAILNPLDSALFSGKFKNAELLKNAAELLVEELKKYGWRQIMVPIGSKFDDTFSPSKFERKFVKSDKPSGVIVGVIRRGFIDQTGVSPQKALLAISE